MPDLYEQIRHCFQGRVCLMGLGNRDYGDDGFGLSLADALKERLTRSSETSRAHRVIPAGTMPERFIGVVKENNFDHLIFLDVVEFGGAPGSAVFLNAGELGSRFPQISTHKISLGLLAKIIEEGSATKAWLLGVQPESLKPASGLTPTLQATLEVLTKIISSFWIFGRETGGGPQPFQARVAGLRAAEVIL